MADRPRILVAVLVYGGREVVPACLDSVRRQTTTAYDVDALVLDDCSPDLAWSEELEELCARSGTRYHRNARNLGIPRNMTLAMQAAAESYDHVVLCNSDVLLGAGVVEHLASVADSDGTVGSVTAWSNNVSIFSLPPAPDDIDASQQAVDLVDGALWEHFGTESLTIPVGVGFCLLVPVRMIERVGVMDPIFGRGYCEEVDWCLRAVELDLRHVLALGGFAFHHGNVSTRAAGLLAAGSTTEWAHEAIIDQRYPWYRELVGAFIGSPGLGSVRSRAAAAVVHDSLRNGYELTVGRVGRGGVEVVIDPGTGAGRARAMGFEVETPTDIDIGGLMSWCGRPPDRVSVLDRGPVARAITEWARTNGIDVLALAPYRFSV